jgi:hypothetical protein
MLLLLLWLLVAIGTGILTASSVRTSSRVVLVSVTILTAVVFGAALGHHGLVRDIVNSKLDVDVKLYQQSVLLGTIQAQDLNGVTHELACGEIGSLATRTSGKFLFHGSRLLGEVFEAFKAGGPGPSPK